MSGPSSGLPESSRPGIARSRMDCSTGSYSSAGGAAGPTCDREVQTGVACLRHQRLQRRDR